MLEAERGMDEAGFAPHGPLLERREVIDRVGRGLTAGTVLLTAEAGFGKSTVVAQAAERSGALVVRVECPKSQGGGDGLAALLADALGAVAPALARPRAPTDPVAVRRLAEAVAAALDRPLVLFLDHAEALRGTPESVELVESLLISAAAPLSVAVATCRSIGLRTGRLRSEGRLLALGPADLAFDASECAALLFASGEPEGSDSTLEHVMDYTRGWPLGVASFVGGAAETRAARLPPSVAGSSVAEAIVEQLFDGLARDHRRALAAVALSGRLDGEMLGPLGLEPDLLGQLASDGLFVRELTDGCYELAPIIRDAVRAAIEPELGGEEARELRRAVAETLAERGRVEEALEGALAAEATDLALELAFGQAERLAGGPPEKVRRLLDRLPPGARQTRLLRGHAAWREGDYERVVELLSPAAMNEAPAGLGRRVLADALLGLGRFDEAAALGGDDTLARAPGEPDALDTGLRSRLADAVVRVDRGDADGALCLLDEVLDDGEDRAPALVELAHVRRAMVLASLGRVAAAELALATVGSGPRIGWRGWAFPAARAALAAARGELGGVADPAADALSVARRGPVIEEWRALAALVPPLVAAGLVRVARDALDALLERLGRELPGPDGALPRASAHALRAFARSAEGHEVDDDLVRAVEEAGDELADLVRREWPRIGPLLWRTLETDRLDVEAVVRALALARPDDHGLVELVRHPRAAVRAAAIGPALASGHPDALALAMTLAGDDDPQTAAKARFAVERLRDFGPPLVFGLFGAFTVRRGPWLVDEAAWERPMTERIVRFLLVHRGSRVPEDALFEAFWPNKDAAAARRALQVSISRARAVLDLPSAETSVIDGRGRAYRLALSERDLVDVDEFELAAAAGLGSRGPARRRLLDRATELWTGEPLAEDRYAEWSLAWRERLRDRFVEVLVNLVEAHRADGDHHAALEAARRLVAFDPLNETGHREVMAALAATGRPADALRQFLEFRRRLVGELGVEPAPATARLQARILAGR